MKTNLKVGDTFEVVEVLTDGNYDDVFKIKGWTTGQFYNETLIDCLCNVDEKRDGTLVMYKGSEVRQVGRLVVTKVK